MGGVFMAALLGGAGLFVGGYVYAQGGWVPALSPTGVGAILVFAAVVDARRLFRKSQE